MFSTPSSILSSPGRGPTDFLTAPLQRNEGQYLTHHFIWKLYFELLFLLVHSPPFIFLHISKKGDLSQMHLFKGIFCCELRNRLDPKPGFHLFLHNLRFIISKGTIFTLLSSQFIFKTLSFDRFVTIQIFHHLFENVYSSSVFLMALIN